MADKKINIFWNAEFGVQGSGNSQFEYPSGICIAASYMYVVDKQNHRVQKFDLDGNYVSQFGSYGTGNDNFNFPESICSDGTFLYIADSANHRIKIHDLNGVFVKEFGSLGTGNDNFDYPTGIIYAAYQTKAVSDPRLYIVDKQNHRVKKHEVNGTYKSEFGSYGTGDTELNFPEGVAFYKSKIIVSDSGNKVVKFYDTTGGYLHKTNITFDYPTGLAVCDTVITVIDRQANNLVFIDDAGNYISEFGSKGSGHDEFFFPYNAFYADDLFYITDSANHKVKIYDFVVEKDIPEHSDLFVKLTKQLYPTGRAWWMKKGGMFEKMHEGLALSEARVYDSSKNLLNIILPDNDDFSKTDATAWERALGLFYQPYLSLAERKSIILQKMQHPGNIPARQHYLYLQGHLRDIGFDVYVHENKFSDPPVVNNPVAALYGEVNYGQVNYGSAGIAHTLIANHITESLDEGFIVGSDISMRATFFIGGAVFSNTANVPLNRKNEFKNLILKIKPAQMVGFLLINYT